MYQPSHGIILPSKCVIWCMVKRALHPGTFSSAITSPTLVCTPLAALWHPVYSMLTHMLWNLSVSSAYVPSSPVLTGVYLELREPIHYCDFARTYRRHLLDFASSV